jgi:fatty aldehyde-generating acyl-ACP reductase
LSEISNYEPLDFAVLGHQESWQNIEMFINGMRSSDKGSLSLEKIKDTFCYIPPRSIFRMKVRSKTGAEINGVYIETFIDPEKLDTEHLRTNIKKVTEAISVAQKLNAKIIALGGFTSIVLEGNFNAFKTIDTKLTTGNTLTSAYILKGIEKAAHQLNIDFNDCSILIIGATGDIGMACTNYLKSSAKQLLLCARNKKRLENFSNELLEQNVSIKYSTDLNEFIPEADIIISVASSKNIEITNCKNKLIICDAGYPKNLEQKIEERNYISLFHGGMGQIKYGYDFNPDYTKHFYNYPTPYIGHGCVLEAIVLAFENKFENYSTGKGNIINSKIEEIYEMSLKHGLEIAPFYNAYGLW